VIELGAGSAAKTPILLEAVRPAFYVPIDISGDFLRRCAGDLAADFPKLQVLPVEADFMTAIPLPEEIQGVAKLGFFPGSTIGNLVASTAVDLLRRLKAKLGVGALLLIGMDRIKDEVVLTKAYDDPAGVTGAFNLNLLERINRELGADIPVDAFRHRAIWNEARMRIEMHLEATRDLAFAVAGRQFTMRAGETIHSENSHKYGARDGRMLLLAAGWHAIREWTDDKGLFALILAEAEPPRLAP